MSEAQHPVVGRDKVGAHNALFRDLDALIRFAETNSFRDLAKLADERLPRCNVGRPRRYSIPMLLLLDMWAAHVGLPEALDTFKRSYQEITRALFESSAGIDGLDLKPLVPSQPAAKRFKAAFRQLRDLNEDILELLESRAAEQAQHINLGVNLGSELLPSKEAWHVLDGVTVRAASSYKPGDQFVAKHTGELRRRRCDVEAQNKVSGDGRNTYGHSFVDGILSSRDNPNERIITTIESLDRSDPARNSETDALLRLAPRLAARYPRAKGLMYDKAVRGSTKTKLARLGFNVCTPPYKTAVGKPKKPHLAAYLESKGLRIPIYAHLGSFWIDTPDGLFKLERTALIQRKRKDGVKPYLRLRVPAHAPVDRRLTGTIKDVAMDVSDTGLDLGEHVQPIDPESDEFKNTMRFRVEIESVHNHLKRNLNQPGSRSRSYGRIATHVDLLYMAFIANEKAVMHFEHRTRRTT